MLAIAVLAGLFAGFGVIVATGVVIVISVVSLPILLARPGGRLRAAVWVSSIYPSLILSSFYATWLTAWCVRGHRPRVYLDDPRDISPIVDAVGAAPYFLLLGAPLIWFVCAPLILAVVYWNMAQRKTSPREGALQLLTPVGAWLLAYAILRCDPGDVIMWYFD
jgi:TRAP-type mannitol/chloroaromatic compound transport system permease large subunit